MFSELWKLRVSSQILFVGSHTKFISFQATCFTKKVNDQEERWSGNFPCSKFQCTRPNCHHYLKVDEKRFGFPFELIEPIGEGGFAKIYRGKFHEDEAAFKFIPIDHIDQYKYNDLKSVGVYEYKQQEEVNKNEIFVFGAMLT